MRRPVAEMYADARNAVTSVTAILSRSEENEEFDARRLALLLLIASKERVR